MNKILNDKELEEVNGSMMPYIAATDSKVSGIEPVIIKPEYEKKTEKVAFIPIPY